MIHMLNLKHAMNIAITNILTSSIHMYGERDMLT